MKKNQKVWIAWEDETSIRSRILAKEIGAEFYAFTRFENISPLRYLTAILQTLITLIKSHPKLLIVQNPSIVLSFFAALVKPFFNYMLIIDLHTLYIHPSGLKKVIMNALDGYALKRGDIVIVSNESYKDKIQKKTKREKICVLPDKFPEFDYEFKKMTLKGKHNILFICTFSEDEPWEEVIQAASSLPKDIYIYISGKNTLNPAEIPLNVVLTGYLPNEAYQNLVRSVDVIMVLTQEEDCMVCGAYEAVSAEKPLILSDKKVLKEYFDQGTLFTLNNSEAIARSVHQAIQAQSNLKEKIKKLRDLRNIEWKKKWMFLLERISNDEKTVYSMIL